MNAVHPIAVKIFPYKPKWFAQHEDVTNFSSTRPGLTAADSLSDLQLPQNSNPMRSTVVRTVSSPVVLL